MKEFRQALDAFLAGQTDLPTLQRALAVSLAKEPHLAAALGAYLEALYRGNRITGEAYLALVQLTRAQADADKTRFRAPGGVNPAPAGEPAARAPASAPGADKTVFRTPKAAASPPTGAREPVAGAADDKTRFRTPRPPAAAEPPPSVVPADATRLRARPVPGTSEAAVQSREAVPAGGDPSWSPTTGSTGSQTGATTGGTGTGSTWSDPNRWSAGKTVALAVGSIIKERFVLEDELGRGGMGIVFKARDLRMEEAQDRNPFVAVKILNDEFKRHPESLKALQREFRKAQSLAHPNVVTVGDFDRDGGNVYMTMELLEGDPLDQAIKQTHEAGLEKRQALRITRDICRAMAYAHERGIVHSDFKPANAFLTRNGVVKVFDFGIARAARTGDRASGTVTLFDAGTLGALTPAYASCEMIEGLEPDVRDDVYAIACVAYELLTGKHPFDRKSAEQARAAGLTPARPPGLSRGQWAALRRGLAFRRENRSASALELLNGLLPPKRSPSVYIGAAAVVLAGVVIAIVVVPNEVRRYEQERWLAALRSGTADRIETVLPVLDEMQPSRRDTILVDRGARDGLIHYYDDLIRRTESRGDYLLANRAATKLLGYLPDYADAQRIADGVANDLNDAIKRQSDRFDTDLGAGRLIPAQGPDNVEAVLTAVRRIDPQHALLRDPRLPGAFAAQTRVALQRSDSALAQKLIASGLALAPNDPTLRDLRDQVSTLALAQARDARVAAVERSLSALLGQHPALAAFAPLRDQMTQLRTDAPDSDVLTRVQQYAQAEIQREVGTLEQQNHYSQAQSLLEQYTNLASPAFIEGQRQQLSAASLAYQHKTADAAQVRLQRIADLKARLGALLQRGPGDDPTRWDAEISNQQGALSAYLAPKDPYFAQVRVQAAAAYLRQAQQLRLANRLAGAEQMLEEARGYGGPEAQLAREEQLVASARSQMAAAAQAQEQNAQTQALQQKLLVQAAANTVNDALTTLAELRGRLPANDPFLTKQGPAAIGGGYLRLAASAALDGRFDEAESLAQKGRAAVPTFAPLGAAQLRYAQYASLNRVMGSVNLAGAEHIRGEINAAQRDAPTEAQALEQALARSMAVRIRSAPSATAAEKVRAVAHVLFPRDSQFAKARLPTTQTKTPVQTPPSESNPASQPAAAPRAGAPVAQTGKPVAVPAPAPAARPLTMHDCANPELLGTGANLRASCWDEIGSGRGPTLVVVPAPPGGRPFAIGRYEVSNADLAQYCNASGGCKAAASAPGMPVTSISQKQAEGYMAWLSSQSGAVYRLPTAAEWVYAANAGSDVSGLDANCQKPGISAGLLPVNSGEHNAWGLYNFDGNVQEWVRGDNGLQARGGDYTDSLSQCKPATARAQSGAPDPVTGFRVLREIK
ncbi:MAG TPA: bifunctional serine/threonine-protein kinase/formylglycine-generating enzyme family protein [Steroidobacteraceae bacterium]|nr:bifunctional serine/threonine-protein kinase/formylglycine-generating enzyme family protein [Steroidobacteraceae bacterium]